MRWVELEGEGWSQRKERGGVKGRRGAESKEGEGWSKRKERGGVKGWRGVE